MTKDVHKKIRHITQIVTSALILLLAAAMILSCLSIYNSGDRPFSREIIAQYFDRIVPLAFLLLVGIIAGLILFSVGPLSQKPPRPLRDEMILLESARRKCSNPQSLHKEQHLRRIIKLGKYAFFAACTLYPALYLAEPSHFSVSNLNSDIAAASWVVMIAFTIGILGGYLFSHYERSSVQREIALCKASPKTNNPSSTDSNPSAHKKFTGAITIARIIVFSLAVCFIVMGILNLGIDDVLGKAIRICTECIGLG